jgi:hypothetical protein
LKLIIIILLLSCVKTFAQKDTKDSSSFIIKGYIYDTKTKESIPFVKVKWNSYETESDLNGFYKLKIPKDLFQSSTTDTTSIKYWYPCYCFPQKKIRAKKSTQTINIKGSICCVELKADPNEGVQEPLIEK